MLAIPITIASATFSIMLFIDTLILPQMLNNQIIEERRMIIEGSYMRGVLAKVLTVINVPLVLSLSLIITVVPSISSSKATNNLNLLNKKVVEVLEVSFKLGLPVAVGIIVLAKPILLLLG